MFKSLFSKKRKRLKTIGYWQSEKDLYYPNPLSFEDKNWAGKEKETVLIYVESGEKLRSYRGYSWCRFGCGHIDMGTKDLTDGEYVWPEGFTHYIEFHNIKPPSVFIKKCKERKVHLGEDNLEKLSELDIEIGRNDKWWVNQGIQNKVTEKVIKYSNDGRFIISNFEENQFLGIIKFLRKFKTFRRKEELEIRELLLNNNRLPHCNPDINPKRD